MVAKCWTGVSLVAESVFSVVILKLRRQNCQMGSQPSSLGLSGSARLISATLDKCKQVSPPPSLPSTGDDRSMVKMLYNYEIYFIVFSLVNGGPK